MRAQATTAQTRMLCLIALFGGLAIAPASVRGHGSMYEPPARNSLGMSLLAPTCSGGACQWYSQGCTIGCAECSQRYDAAPDCETPAEPTLRFGEDDHLLQCVRHACVRRVLLFVAPSHLSACFFFLRRRPEHMLLPLSRVVACCVFSRPPDENQ